MHVADMLAVGAAAACVAHTPDQAPLLQLALDYFCGASCVDAGLKPPTLAAVEAPSLTLKAADAPPDVARPHVQREGRLALVVPATAGHLRQLDLKAWGRPRCRIGLRAAQAASVQPPCLTVPMPTPMQAGLGDGELFLLDSSLDAQKKVKKSFCEPANAADCPPLVLAEHVVLAHGAPPATLVCGDKTYGTACASFAELQEAYASGALHPSELKPAVNKAVDAVLERVRGAVAADPKLKDAEKEMAKVHKRMAAKK